MGDVDYAARGAAMQCCESLWLVPAVHLTYPLTSYLLYTYVLLTFFIITKP